MGQIVEPIEARISGCTCYKIDPEGGKNPNNLVCYSDGVIGSLSDKQDETLCSRKFIKLGSEEMSGHMSKFKQSGEIMDICMEEGVSKEEFFGCVEERSKQLKNKYS